jgi:hypothetical protein
MQDPNTMMSIAHVKIRDNNYTAYISMCMVTRNIHVFKYDEARGQCDYEVFDCQYLASQWLEKPLFNFNY